MNTPFAGGRAVHQTPIFGHLRSKARLTAVRCDATSRDTSNNLIDVPRRLVESFRTWHSARETPASVKDYTEYWVNKTLPAAKTDQETSIAYSYRDFDALLEKSRELLQVLGAGPDALMEIISREPGVLLMSANEVAMRLLALKSAVPNLDIQELVKRRPKVLRDRHGVEAVSRAIRDLEALMPALPVQKRILEGDGQMWQSFRERLLYWETQLKKV